MTNHADSKTTVQKIAEKWGFGLAPERLVIRRKREASARCLVEALNVPRMPVGDGAASVASAISEVQGLYNRTHRQDQWDWFLVWALLGRIPAWLAREVAGSLKVWRRAILSEDEDAAETARMKLVQLGVQRHLRNYLVGRTDWKGGVVYILSRRCEPNILKIGFTIRDPIVRAAEINSATGILEPYGVRAAWAVDEAATTEREIHDLLADWRIRSDREFFYIDFKDAFRIINGHIRS